MTGVYGKLPTHGDFVRRDLPLSFVEPWDAWLQACIAAAHAGAGPAFDAQWAALPAWRFCLPAGACGDDRVAGVMLASRDAVGRPFPLTLAAIVPRGGRLPNEAWYAAVEQAGLSACREGHGVDALLAALPTVEVAYSFAPDAESPGEGWWTREGRRLRATALPTEGQFRRMLDDSPREMVLSGRGATHRGTVRQRNEDAFVERADIGLWAVADGAGGHGDGNLASAAVVQALAELPQGLSAAETLAQVRLGMDAVHAQLQARAAASPNGQLTVSTVVVLLARGQHFACLWAGDSRAYLMRDDTLCQVTRDHSHVQELVEAGLLAAEDAESHPQANVITRAVGSEAPLELDKVAGGLLPGDRLLLCTDGLFKALPESTIAQILVEGGGPDQLIERSLQAGARDNVTALLVAVQD